MSEKPCWGKFHNLIRVLIFSQFNTVIAWMAWEMEEKMSTRRLNETAPWKCGSWLVPSDLRFLFFCDFQPISAEVSKLYWAFGYLDPSIIKCYYVELYGSQASTGGNVRLFRMIGGQGINGQFPFTSGKAGERTHEQQGLQTPKPKLGARQLSQLSLKLP